MRAIAVMMCILLSPLVSPLAAIGTADQWKDHPIASAAITILYDNNPFAAGLKTGWGFSALVEAEQRAILFDTGGSGKTILSNMERLGKDPGAITVVIISHGHGDHTGGLSSILEANTRLKVFLPQSFPQGFSRAIKARGAEAVEVGAPMSPFPGIYSTGEMGEAIPEQALIVSTIHGLVVITGCAHPGIVNMVARANALLKKEVYLVLGGFHLLSKSDREIESVIGAFKKMGVKKVAPCHCTGDRARKLFEQGYRDGFIRAGVGRVIRIGENETER